MRINILLPVFNGADFISDQIESILKQSIHDIRLLIRDDGSCDNSKRIIDSFQQKYPDIISVIHGPLKNIGLIESLNYLYEADHNSDYYMFADQDDVWLPNKIQLTLDKMREIEDLNPKLPVMICTDSTCVDENLRILEKSFFRSQKFPYDTFDNISKMIALNVVQGCTMMINNIGMKLIFPLPSWIKVHDSYISVFIAEKGKVVYLHESTMLYRQHSQNVLGSIDIGIGYYLSRSKQAINTIKYIVKFKNSLASRPSLISVLYYKIKYAIQRILN